MTVVALEHLGNCSFGGTPYCERLHDDLTRWVSDLLASRDLRMRPRLRPKALLLLSRLRAKSGDSQAALELAGQAARESGYHISYVRVLVNIHLARNEPARARELVDRLLDPRFRAPGNERVVRELGGTIDAWLAGRGS